MRRRYATLAAPAVASLLSSGCAVLREFKPAVDRKEAPRQLWDAPTGRASSAA